MSANRSDESQAASGGNKQKSFTVTVKGIDPGVTMDETQKEIISEAVAEAFGVETDGVILSG